MDTLFLATLSSIFIFQTSSEKNKVELIVTMTVLKRVEKPWYCWVSSVRETSNIKGLCEGRGERKSVGKSFHGKLYLQLFFICFFFVSTHIIQHVFPSRRNNCLCWTQRCSVFCAALLHRNNIIKYTERKCIKKSFVRIKKKTNFFGSHTCSICTNGAYKKSFWKKGE